MTHFKRPTWHEPEAEEFRRYLKEKKVMQALQPALTLLYSLPVKPTDLYEFFAEYLENGARTMVKLSLLKAEHCFIKNEIHVMKNQLRQMKERIIDAEAIIKSFKEGTNPLQDESRVHKFSLIDRFINDAAFDNLHNENNNSTQDMYNTASQFLLKIEQEMDEEDEERREMEPILKFIEDHQEIDPLGILFDFRIPEPEDVDEDFEDIAKPAVLRSQHKGLSRHLRSQSVFVRANDGNFEKSQAGHAKSEDFSDDEGLQAAAITHGRLVIGMSRLHEKRKADRKLVRRPIAMGEDFSRELSSESSSAAASDPDDYDSATSVLKLYNELRIDSRMKEEKGHRKLLRVLHAKKVKLLSGGNDWLPVKKDCRQKHRDEEHKQRKAKKAAEKRDKKRREKTEARKGHEVVPEEVIDRSAILKELGLAGSPSLEGGNQIEQPKKTVKPKSPKKKPTKNRKLKPYHDKAYASIGIDTEIAEKERFHRTLGNHGSIKEDVDDDYFLHSLDPYRESFAVPTRSAHLVPSISVPAVTKLRTNSDFVFEFPLEQVLEAQQWIDNNFTESVWHLNEPIEGREDETAFDDDDDDNYVWLEDYAEERVKGYPKEFNDDNLTVSRKMLQRIHQGVKHQKHQKKLEKRVKSCRDGREANIPRDIVDESDLPKMLPVASVPSLLKAQLHSQGTGTGTGTGKPEEKRSEKTKRFVREMFDEQYRKRLMNNFHFDMLDDD